MEDFADTLRANLRTARCILLREELYASGCTTRRHGLSWNGKFLDSWYRKIIRFRIEPLKKFARMLRNTES